MLGAIIGDIAGSMYERKRYRIKTKDFPFFGKYCCFTDDTVCTIAVADILLHDLPPAETMQVWCRRYHGRGYGGMFRKWRDSDVPEPYNSYGNGAAMRVSPAAFLNRDDLAAALSASDKVTEITHNHPEGMKGARATTHAIWLAFQGKNPADIRRTITAEYGYDLTQTVDEIRSDYPSEYPPVFTPGFPGPVTCMGSVPQAITCALESVSYEDAVRNAISLGGDSDTLAAIAGPIAEALHGIPDDLIKQTKNRYLIDAPDIRVVIEKMLRTGNEGIMRGRSSIPQDIREILGENIRRERVIRNMTQAELAQKIGTSQMMVSRFEKGKDSPSVWRCYGIAKVLDTTVERLLTGIDPHVQPIRSEEAIVFGSWLKECRERRNMTLDDVAKIVRYPPGYIRYIETDGDMPDRELHEALIALFGDPSD